MQEMPQLDDTGGRDLFETIKAGAQHFVSRDYMISQAKTELSGMALKRQLGVSYPTFLDDKSGDHACDAAT